MTRVCLPERRRTWRQKVVIRDRDSGDHTFYVEFGEYPDGRLGEVFITAHRTGTFVRGTLDALARTTSLALQSGTSPLEVARTMRGMDYPPAGAVEAEGSAVTECSSLADYVGQEIAANYGADGRRLLPPVPNDIIVSESPELIPEVGEHKVAGYKSEPWRTGV